MDAVMALHLAVYLGVVALIGYAALTNDWSRYEVVGIVIALAGLWLMFFLDDALAVLSIEVPIIVGFEELIGIAIMLPGLLLRRWGESQTEVPPPTNGTGA